VAGQLKFRAAVVALQVCALLSGGGYAKKVVVPAGQLLLVPEGMFLEDALHRLVHRLHDQPPFPIESFLVRSIFYFQENRRTRLAR
jgi:uncharacterized membrane protein